MNRKEDLSPKIKEPKIIVKKIKIQSTGRQLIIQLPVIITEVLNLKKGDGVIIKIPLENKKNYSIRFAKIK